METNELSFKDYPYLKELGLNEENLGSYDGKKWCGSGKLMYKIK